MTHLADQPEAWPVSATRDIHRDDWVVALREDTVSRPGDPEDCFDRLVLEHPGAVVVLAVDDDDRVCLIRQYRHAASGRNIELPAGLRDAGPEDPVEVAKRELREEVELQASDWRLLMQTWPSAGITSERHWIYLARGLTRADRGDFVMRHEEAEIEVLWSPFEELLRAVLEGRVQEGPLAIAVLSYEVLRSRGEL